LPARSKKIAAGAAGPAVNRSGGKEEVAKLLKDASELCRELNTRWLEITAGNKPSFPKLPGNDRALHHPERRKYHV
jgi:hypothetical protein